MSSGSNFGYTCRFVRLLAEVRLQFNAFFITSHPFEPPHAAAVDLDFLEEHLGGTHPKAKVAVEELIDRHRLQCLTVRREAEKPVHLPLVMAEVMPDAGLPLLWHHAFCCYRIVHV